MKFRLSFLVGLVMVLTHGLVGQTVGTVKYTDLAHEKLCLVNPVNNTHCYLIDNCGYIVNEWETSHRPGLAVHLDSSGALYRAGRISSSVFKAGGLGGVIEKYDWDGTKLWEYRLANDSMHLHHDFYVRTNGHIIAIAWELIPQDELLSSGRNPGTVRDEFYSERIIEIDPDSDFEIVWEWKAFDHIVQEYDDQLQNFASVSEMPQRFDINLNRVQGLNFIDWLHINSVDLDEETDLLLLSCNAIDEIVLIDHSTTVEEASGSAGGRYGHGGDLLYRIGNPGNYDERDNFDQLFFAHHDARWIDSEDRLLNISLFNNGRRNGNINFSAVELYSLNYEANDLIMGFNAIRPDSDLEPIWSYNAQAMQGLYSKRMSSARYQDGHWTICSSDDGRIIEIDQGGRILWEYINPVGPNQVFSQGDSPFGNTLFSVPVYLYEYFDESLNTESSNIRIELNASDSCDIESTTVSVYEELDLPFKVWFAAQSLNIEAEGSYQLRLYDTNGNHLWHSTVFENDFCSHIWGLSEGIYFLKISSTDGSLTKTIKLYYSK